MIELKRKPFISSHGRNHRLSNDSHWLLRAPSLTLHWCDCLNLLGRVAVAETVYDLDEFCTLALGELVFCPVGLESALPFGEEGFAILDGQKHRAGDTLVAWRTATPTARLQTPADIWKNIGR